MIEELILKILPWVYIFSMFSIGTIISDIGIFREKIWVRFLFYIFSIIPAFLGATIIIAYEGSSELAFSDFGVEFQGKLVQIGVLAFYLGTSHLNREQNAKIKWFKYLLGCMAIIGAVTNLIFLVNVKDQIANILVSKVYQLRPIILLIFAFSMFFPKLLAKYIND